MGTKREKKLSGDKTKGQKPLLQKIQELGETEKTVENDWEQKPKNKTYFYDNSGGLKKENKNHWGNTRTANANRTMVFEIKIHTQTKKE